MNGALPTVVLASTGRTTTQVGFGGSGLMTRYGRRRSLALLEHAYACGVRHVDVAPTYGFGEAEACVGVFLRRHPGEVTVTTKAGLPRPRTSAARRLARAAGRRALAVRRALPARATSGPRTPPVTRTEDIPVLTVEHLRASLTESLRALAVDHVDVLLLHEASVEGLGDDRVLEFLQSAVRRGDIGSFGIGCTAERARPLWQQRPQYCGVVQTERSILTPALDFPGAFTIQYRTLYPALDVVGARLREDPDAARRASAVLGDDLADDVLAGLMFRAALQSQPGVTLFSSRSPEHISSLTAAATRADLAAPAAALAALAESWR